MEPSVSGGGGASASSSAGAPGAGGARLGYVIGFAGRGVRLGFRLRVPDSALGLPPAGPSSARREAVREVGDGVVPRLRADCLFGIGVGVVRGFIARRVRRRKRVRCASGAPDHSRLLHDLAGFRELSLRGERVGAGARRLLTTLRRDGRRRRVGASRPLGKRRRRRAADFCDEKPLARRLARGVRPPGDDGVFRRGNERFRHRELLSTRVLRAGAQPFAHFVAHALDAALDERLRGALDDHALVVQLRDLAPRFFPRVDHARAVRSDQTPHLPAHIHRAPVRAEPYKLGVSRARRRRALGGDGLSKETPMSRFLGAAVVLESARRGRRRARALALADVASGDLHAHLRRGRARYALEHARPGRVPAHRRQRRVAAKPRTAVDVYVYGEKVEHFVRLRGGARARVRGDALRVRDVPDGAVRGAHVEPVRERVHALEREPHRLHGAAHVQVRRVAGVAVKHELAVARVRRRRLAPRALGGVFARRRVWGHRRG